MVIVTGRNMSKHNRVQIIFMLPFLALTFLVGWCLSWTDRKSNHTNKRPDAFFAHHRMSMTPKARIW